MRRRENNDGRNIIDGVDGIIHCRGGVSGTDCYIVVCISIPNVIGDLSGRNARKSIERMRKSNENTGRKSYRSSAVNAARSKLTEAMTERQPRKKKSDKAWMRREYYKIRRNKRILRRQQNF